MKKLFWVVIFFSKAVQGADSVDTLHGIIRNEPSLKAEIQREQAHWFSQPELIGGMKSENRLGRVSGFGQSIRSREEMFLGVKTAAGWAVSVSGGYTMGSGSVKHSGSGTRPRATKVGVKDAGSEIVDVADMTAFGLDRTGVQDPTLTLQHPIFETMTTNLSGLFRESFPVSEFSSTRHIWSQSYYLALVTKLPKGYRLANTLTFHYISKDTYNPPFDTGFSSGIITSLSRRLNDWCRVGGGQKSQMDVHQQGPVGSSVALFTNADFTITPRVYAGPRVTFPIASQNAAFADGPTNPSIGNIQAEIYLQAAL